MNSRTIFFINKKAENISAHQRLIRASRHAIMPYLPPKATFPSAQQIIHFEGKNGPDGLASKHAVSDAPSDFINPKKLNGPLFNEIKDHIYNAHIAVKRQNDIRLNFELAWLSHLVIDGLTPAHHQPLKEQLKTIDSRTEEEVNSRIKRVVYTSSDPIEALVNNWKRLGPRGIGTNHVTFETGIDFLIMPLTPRYLAGKITVTTAQLKKVKSGHFLDLYKKAILKIDSANLFERYEQSSWTTNLATDIRELLIPTAIHMVVLAWLAAIYKGKA